jgi:3-deoxy-manno-octulosonate cytidylyltransferase (CMP-KDO synthetase)
MKKKVAAVIPARMAASRFPGKPLAKILDLPMIEHVRRRALLCDVLDQVYVATCDQSIMDVVTAAGGQAVMTRDTHQRCTDRVEEAAEHITADIIVILQGDEPLFDAGIIRRLVTPMLKDDKIVCTNLLTPIKDKKDLNDVDIVKALTDPKGYVIYFSRSAVPHFRVAHDCPVFRQTGLSAFTTSFLREFSRLAPTPLEITESVDFMRIIEHRFPILGITADQRSVGVDRPDDVGIIENILKNDPVQKKIYQEIKDLGGRS